MFIIVKVRPWNCIYLFIYCTLGVRILFPNLINNLFINVECGWLKFRSIIYFIWTFSMLWINLPAHSLAWTEATWGVTDCWSSSDRLWKVMSWSGTLTPREDMGRWEKKRKIQFTFLCIVCVAHYTENLLTHIQACMWGDVRVKVHAALLWLVLVRCSSTPQHSPRSRLVSLTSIFCCFCQQRDLNCNPTVTMPRFLLLSQIHPKITFRIHHQHYLYHHHTKH